VVLGDGEEVVGAITSVVGAWKMGGRGERIELLRALARVPGVYVPSLYEAVYDGPRLVAVNPIDDAAPERPAHRCGALSAQRRAVSRVHPRLSFLSGGHDHAAGA
jgi:radical SAM superfamily enzyme YgiQ (UPF0313 family)